MVKKAKKAAETQADVTAAEAPRIELSAEFRALEKMFLKSIVENPKTPVEVYAALSPWNLERVVQDSANNGEGQSRRHNPALAAYLKDALQNDENFPANVLSVLLRKQVKADYFKKLQNAALDHIERFPAKAEEAVEYAAKRRPERWVHDAEGLKRKRHTATKTHYALVDITFEGERVGSPLVPTAGNLKDAREKAYVQFWNDYVADQQAERMVAPDASKPSQTPVKFRYKTPLKLGSVTPKFNDSARFDLPALAAEKGYSLNYEQGQNVEIMGQKGVTATFTMAGKYSKNRPFEFTVTRFGASTETADNLAAMSILAQYHNNSPTPKQ